MSETIIKGDNPLPMLNELVKDFQELKVAVNVLECDYTRLIAALKEAKCFLDRLGSMEAFCAPRAVHSSNDEELLARIDYAREKSESLKKVLETK